MTLADIGQDLRYGLRTMRKNPVFSLVAALTIAIGIGANVLVFTLVERILLSELPYREPDRLVRLIQSYPENGLETWGLSPANFARYRDGNRSFEAIAAYSTAGATLTGADNAEYVQMGRVSADFFKVFGVSPVLGRTFLPDEDTKGKNSLCVLSYNLWQRRFGGNPHVIGQTLTINDTSNQVIGVMPASFRFPAQQVELWTPLTLNPQQMNPFVLVAVARLKPGLTIEAAAEDTTAVLWNAATENPGVVLRKSPPTPGLGLKTKVTPLKEWVVGKIEKPLLILQIAVGFVLLIACANVANLLLSRATKRTHEIALRFAVGATRGRVVRQLLTESLLLALVGALAGLAFAWWALRTLTKIYAEGIPRIEEASISRTVLLVTVGVTVLTGVLFGLVPAFRASWLGVKTGLSEGQKGSAGATNRFINSTLVTVQLALSLVLLIGAALMVKSFQQLLTFNPGYETDKVLTMTLAISNKKYEALPQSTGFYKKVLDEVRALPGVNGASVASVVPLGGRGAHDGHIVEGQEPQGEEAPQAEIKVVSNGFFQSLRIPLQKGREFQSSDTPDTPLVAIVDEKMARQYWPNGDAIGKRIRTLDPDWYTIVGIAPTIQGQGLTEELAPHLYLSFEQLGFAYGQTGRMFLIVNTDKPTSIVSTIRDRVRALDPEVPVYAINTMSEVIAKRHDSQRLISFLLTAFSTIALVLAAIGTYGVLSVFVSSRESEFAIRLALGATPRKLLFSVLKQGLLLAAAGAAFGLFGSWALTRGIASQLFGVSTVDPAIFVLTPVVLIAVALLACYLPARRAARTDPASVLRSS